MSDTAEVDRLREERNDLASVLADMAYAISPGDGKDFAAIGWNASYEQHFRPVMMRAQKLLKRRYSD